MGHVTTAPDRVAPGASPTDSHREVRALVGERRFDEAWAVLRPLLRRSDDAAVWSAARNVLRAGAKEAWTPAGRRSARLAVLSTATSADLVAHLEIACRALDVDV